MRSPLWIGRPDCVRGKAITPPAAIGPSLGRQGDRHARDARRTKAIAGKCGLGLEHRRWFCPTAATRIVDAGGGIVAPLVHEQSRRRGICLQGVGCSRRSTCRSCGELLVAVAVECDPCLRARDHVNPGWGRSRIHVTLAPLPSQPRYAVHRGISAGGIRDRETTRVTNLGPVRSPVEAGYVDDSRCPIRRRTRTVQGRPSHR